MPKTAIMPGLLLALGLSCLCAQTAKRNEDAGGWVAIETRDANQQPRRELVPFGRQTIPFREASFDWREFTFKFNSGEDVESTRPMQSIFRTAAMSCTSTMFTAGNS